MCWLLFGGGDVLNCLFGLFEISGMKACSWKDLFLRGWIFIHESWEFCTCWFLSLWCSLILQVLEPYTKPVFTDFWWMLCSHTGAAAAVFGDDMNHTGTISILSPSPVCVIVDGVWTKLSSHPTNRWKILTIRSLYVKSHNGTVLYFEKSKHLGCPLLAGCSIGHWPPASEGYKPNWLQK